MQYYFYSKAHKINYNLVNKYKFSRIFHRNINYSLNLFVLNLKDSKC